MQPRQTADTSKSPSFLRSIIVITTPEYRHRLNWPIGEAAMCTEMPQISTPHYPGIEATSRHHIVIS